MLRLCKTCSLASSNGSTIFNPIPKPLPVQASFRKTCSLASSGSTICNPIPKSLPPRKLVVCWHEVQASMVHSTIPRPRHFSKTTSEASLSGHRAPPTKWRSPRDNYIKVNCDAAYNQASGEGFSGIIFRDNQGSVLTASSGLFYANSPLIAEALCLREAVSMAVTLDLQWVIFESDNQVLIEVCRKNVIRREIKGIVEDIQNLRGNFQGSDFTWTKREGNNCAHVIASSARDNLLHGP